MLEEFENKIKNIIEEINNDAYDEELDELTNELTSNLLDFSAEELKELLNKSYILPYKELIIDYLKTNNRWED